MKKLLLLLALSIVGPFAHGQSPTPDATAKPAPTPNRETQILMDKALADFNADRLDAALAKLAVIEKKVPEDPFILNLYGSISTKKKDFPAAKQFFERSLAKQPNFFAAKFNIGEVLFLEGRYAEALAYFEEMQRDNPSNEILQFKIFLCELQMAHMEEAAKKLKKIKYPGETPAWYYAQAAWELKNNNKNKAREYISGAKYIFEGKTGFYDETFKDLGINLH